MISEYQGTGIQNKWRLILSVMMLSAILATTSKAATALLPEDIHWLTNDSDPVYASADAVTGGTLNTAVLSFPLTFRTVGPDSNGSFRDFILNNNLSLIDVHPNTGKIIPELATHWAFGKDGKTMYFKLDPHATWSDGKPVTADDYVFTLEFMRSKYIVAPWYNDFYTQEIDRVIVYDDYTIAVVGKKAEPDLYLKLAISPTPRHYYGTLGPDFVSRYNWKIVPNTGPYQIADFQMGKYVHFKRKKDWWGKDLRYFKNRFNADRVNYTVIRDFNMLWEYFKKGKQDVFGLVMPQYWHDKCQIPVFEKGYVDRTWFFNDKPRSAVGIWLNMDREIFKDPNVRYAFAHAMNIEKVIDQVLRGDYFRLEQAFVGYGPYTNNAIKARRFDLAKVDHYMKASGWHRGADGIWGKGGKRFSVDVIYGFEEYTPRLVVLKEEAKKAGIELILQQSDSAAAFKRILEKNFDVAWMGWSTSLRPQYWEFFHSVNAHKPQTNNITNTDDPEMDKLIEAYRNSLNEAERIRLSRKIQQRIHDIGMFVPTFMIPYTREAYWRWWRLPTPPGTRLTNDLFDPFNSTTGGLFWYDQKRHDETLKAMKDGRSFPPVTIVDKTYQTPEESPK